MLADIHVSSSSSEYLSQAADTKTGSASDFILSCCLWCRVLSPPSLSLSLPLSLPLSLSLPISLPPSLPIYLPLSLPLSVSLSPLFLTPPLSLPPPFTLSAGQPEGICYLTEHNKFHTTSITHSFVWKGTLPWPMFCTYDAVMT